MTWHDHNFSEGLSLKIQSEENGVVNFQIFMYTRPTILLHRNKIIHFIVHFASCKQTSKLCKWVIFLYPRPLFTRYSKITNVTKKQAHHFHLVFSQGGWPFSWKIDKYSFCFVRSFLLHFETRRSLSKYPNGSLEAPGKAGGTMYTHFIMLFIWESSVLCCCCMHCA